MVTEWVAPCCQTTADVFSKCSIELILYHYKMNGDLSIFVPCWLNLFYCLVPLGFCMKVLNTYIYIHIATHTFTEDTFTEDAVTFHACIAYKLWYSLEVYIPHRAHVTHTSLSTPSLLTQCASQQHLSSISDVKWNSCGLRYMHDLRPSTVILSDFDPGW